MDMKAHRLEPSTLWLIIRQQGFNVKRLAMYFGLSTRTLERRFRQQFRTTPKIWITHERMRLAPPLLADGFSNKEVAASLHYTCESNFCRDFKRCFGYAPQEFRRVQKKAVVFVSRFEKELSQFDKAAELKSAVSKSIFSQQSVEK
jgi:AraC-like DNA-binding protein